jgi:hypothetical protein
MHLPVLLRLCTVRCLCWRSIVHICTNKFCCPASSAAPSCLSTPLQLVQDHELNQLLHLAGADTWELYAVLRAQQQRLQQVLTLQLTPCVTVVTEAAQGAVGQQQREAAYVGKLPLLALTAPVQIAGAHNAAGAGECLLSCDDTCMVARHACVA